MRRRATTDVWMAVANGVLWLAPLSTDPREPGERRGACGGTRSGREVQVILFLASNGGEWFTQDGELSQEWWAFRMGVKQRTLQRALAHLLGTGVVEVTRTSRRDTYRLTDEFLKTCANVVLHSQELRTLARLHAEMPQLSRNGLLIEHGKRLEEGQQ